MVIMGLTAGALATVPAMALDLGASQTEVQWITDCYPVILAPLLLPTGALLDRYGRRLGMLVGLVVLLSGLVVTALASTVGLVVLGRCVSGVGAAIVFPGTLATISAVMPGDERQAAVNAWALSATVGAIGGMLLSAVFTQVASWHVAFWVFVAVTALLLVLTAWAVPETRAEHDAGFDLVGGVVSAVGMGALAAAVTVAPTEGWLSATALGLAVAGLVLALVFVGWEVRHPAPLLDVRLLVDGRFGAASMALLAAFVAHFGIVSLLFQYEQYALGYDTLKAALGLVPVSVPFGLLIVGPRLARRIGTRAMLTTSLGIVIAGALVSAAVSAAGATGYVPFAMCAALAYCGVGLLINVPTTMIIEALPAAKQGVGSAVNDLTRELGAAFGIAIAGSAFNGGYRAAITEHGASLPHAELGALLASPLAAIGDPRLTALAHDGVHAGWRIACIVVAAVVGVGAAVVYWRCPAAEPLSGDQGVPRLEPLAVGGDHAADRSAVRG
jgi:MFS family permease